MITANRTDRDISGDTVTGIGKIAGMMPLNMVMGVKRRKGKTAAQENEHQRT